MIYSPSVGGSCPDNHRTTQKIKLRFTAALQYYHYLPMFLNNINNFGIGRGSERHSGHWMSGAAWCGWFFYNSCLIKRNIKAQIWPSGSWLISVFATLPASKLSILSSGRDKSNLGFANSCGHGIRASGNSELTAVSRMNGQHQRWRFWALWNSNQSFSIHVRIHNGHLPEDELSSPRINGDWNIFGWMVGPESLHLWHLLPY